MTNERVQQDEFNQSRPKTIVARLTEQLAAQDREIERLRALIQAMVNECDEGQPAKAAWLARRHGDARSPDEPSESPSTPI
jgi:uncharacterized coiled-coil protein SlyX